jgi:hypothetical protein
MVAPVPAQISKLAPRSPARLRRRSLPLLTTHHPLPTLFLSPLCFHTLTNCFSRKPFVFTLICVAPGCGASRLSPKLSGPSNVPTLLFASAWSLFVVSLRSFLRSFPLFSIGCSLFSEDTRGGGTSAAATFKRLRIQSTQGWHPTHRPATSPALPSGERWRDELAATRRGAFENSRGAPCVEPVWRAKARRHRGPTSDSKGFGSLYRCARYGHLL